VINCVIILLHCQKQSIYIHDEVMNFVTIFMGRINDITLFTVSFSQLDNEI